MPSFDVVSEPDYHEIKNAVDQAQRELTQRYDFRGTEAELEYKETFKLSANSEDRVKAVYEVLKDKFARRKVSLKFLDPKDPQPAGGMKWTMAVEIKKGIDKDSSKTIVGLIKSDKSLKVTSAIQGDAVRVTGKKRDDLQAVMSMLKEQELEVALSFNNFRD